jgi:DNA repair protein RadC
MGTKLFGKIDVNHFETNPELAEIKVSYKSKQKSKVKISNSKEVYNVLFPLYDKDIIEFKEQFFLLLLNRANTVLGWIMLSCGGTSGTVVDPKIIFVLALKTNASAIILSHNHPSSGLRPSEMDIKITKNISEAARLFNIALLDHIIVAPDGGYYSFADEGDL